MRREGEMDGCISTGVRKRDPVEIVGALALSARMSRGCG